MLTVTRFLNQTRFLQCGVRPVLVDGFDGFGRDGNGNGLLEFGNINTLLLQVQLAAVDAGWIELRRAGAVAVAAGALGTAFGDGTEFHSRSA